MDPTRLEFSPVRLRQIQYLVEEIRRRQAAYSPPQSPQPCRRTRQYPQRPAQPAVVVRAPRQAPSGMNRTTRAP